MQVPEGQDIAVEAELDPVVQGIDVRDLTAHLQASALSC